MAKANAQPTAWKRTKQRFKRAGRALRKNIMLPLVATIMAGCVTPPSSLSDNCPAKTDPCNSYNETTVTINRGEFDESRPVASVDRLRETDGFMGEELRHAVWATHMLSTEPLPEGFETKVTYLDDESCFHRSDGRVLTAFARGPYYHCDLSGVFGFYTLLEQLTLDQFSLIVHEIGHLQGQAGEIAAEINAVEQSLMLSVVYTNQDSREDELVWAAQNTNELFGMLNLKRKAKRIDNDDALDLFQSDKYASADIFILDMLGKHDGDFAIIRAETDALWKRPLLDEKDRKVASFLDEYAGSNEKAVLASIITKIRIAFMKELRRRFGEETARRFFDANSYAAYHSDTQMSIVYGLEDFNCAQLAREESHDSTRCTISCEQYGAEKSFRITGARFLCTDMNYRTWKVTVNGTQYLANGEKVLAQGVECDSVVVFNELVAQVPIDL